MSLNTNSLNFLEFFNSSEAQLEINNMMDALCKTKVMSDEQVQALFTDAVYDPKALNWLREERLSNIKFLLGRISGFAFYDKEATVGESLLLFAKIHLCGLSTLVSSDARSLYWQIQCQTKAAYCGLLSLNSSNIDYLEELKLNLKASSDTLKTIKIPQIRLAKKLTEVQKLRNEQALFRGKALNDSILATP